MKAQLLCDVWNRYWYQGGKSWSDRAFTGNLTIINQPKYCSSEAGWMDVAISNTQYGEKCY